MREVVIAGAARTPMGGFQGVFAGASAPQLGGVAIEAALADAGAAPESVNELVMG
ncbi:MAG: acetyl-CoA C-acetyltransferase, partial [Alphaproteobacteria bacterium]